MEKLNVSPEDVLNFQPKVDFKGYSPSEVDAFLDLILADYQTTEANIQELLDVISSLQDEISKLNNEIVELKGKARSFDLSNTTSYSSVDLLKRLSRLEEEVYGNNK
ncbi:MAG: DivIVA domain-containing protein [Erysipelotrichaceae bacterium]|nr:DivIVA domain-containing protein [Erysipelotrichaceae bacterium]